MASAATRQNKPISPSQIKRIHSMIHELQINDCVYREILSSRFGVTTSKDLTLHQASTFIDELAQKTREKTLKRFSENKTFGNGSMKHNELGGREGMATPPQLRKIEAAWGDVSVTTDPAKRIQGLRHFIQRIAGVSALRFLDWQGASKVINALTAMQEAKQKKQNAKNAM